MRNKQPGVFQLPLRSSKTSTAAGGSRKRASSAPPEYQTHFKEPCGLRKSELITGWFGWWFFWNGFHVWDEVDMFRWWGRLGNHRPGFRLEMFMGRVVVVKNSAVPWINRDRSKSTGNQPKSGEISWSGKEWPNEAQAGAAMIICMVTGSILEYPWHSAEHREEDQNLKCFHILIGESPDVGTFKRQPTW